MKPRAMAFVLALCLVALPDLAFGQAASPAAVSPQKTDALTDVARELYEQGSAAFEKNEFEKAYAAFVGAWRLKKHWQIAANLGASAEKLGKHREAAEALSYYLREAPKEGHEETRKEAEEVMKAARAQVFALRLTVSEEGAEVRLDGELLGTAPLGDALFLDAGLHKLEVKKEGFEPGVEMLSTKAGEARDVRVVLRKKGERQERSMVGPGIAFGVGGAGLIVGVIATVITATKTDGLHERCGDSLKNCPESARGDGDAALAAAHTGTVGFVFAGLGAAVGTTLLLLPIRDPKSASLAVTVGPASVGLKGAF